MLETVLLYRATDSVEFVLRLPVVLGERVPEIDFDVDGDGDRS